MGVLAVELARDGYGVESSGEWMRCSTTTRTFAVELARDGYQRLAYKRLARDGYERLALAVELARDGCGMLGRDGHRKGTRLNRSSSAKTRRPS